MNMQQNRSNKTQNKLIRGIGVTIGALILVGGSATALTLDTNVIRNIPVLQRLLITEQGDQTSISVVELSGTNNQLIRLLPAMGTSNILLAPLGQFIKSSSISGSAILPGSIGASHIANGSLMPEDFAFTITSYSGFGGGAGGSINDGTCPIGQIATSFVNGNITCSPASLISGLPIPLCGGGTTFGGWSGIGIAICTSTGGAIGGRGGDYWQSARYFQNDIYFGIASGRTSYRQGSGSVPGTQILIYGGNGPDLTFAPMGYPVASETCTCSIPYGYTNYSTLPGCTLYSGGAVPQGYIADSGTKALLAGLPAGTQYAFATPKAYYNWNGASSSGHNQCRDLYWSGLQSFGYRNNGFESTGNLVIWSMPVYTGVFQGNEKVGVGLDTPLESLHVASASTGTDVQYNTTYSFTSNISYSTGPLMGALYAVRLGTLVSGKQCPCDTDPYNTDSACSQSPTYQIPPPVYGSLGNQTCYDMNINGNGYDEYALNVTYANNIYTFNVGSFINSVGFGMSRCSCDKNPSYDDCQQGQMNISYPTIPWYPSDAYFFHGINKGPSCYGVSLQGGGTSGVGPWAVTKWDKVMDEYYRQFRFVGNGSAAAATNPKCSCDTSSSTTDCTTPTFVGINPTNSVGYSCNDYTNPPVKFNTFTAMTGYLSSTGTITYGTSTLYTITSTASGGRPTLRADDQGSILVQSNIMNNAGTVGALTISYNGPNVYVNGGRVGINTDAPQAAVDIVGDIRFSNVGRFGYTTYLSVNNDGFLISTGDLNSPNSQWFATSSSTGLAGAIYYYPLTRSPTSGLSTGTVIIGATQHLVGWSGLMLYVSGDVTATNMRLFSDAELKKNVTALTNTLPKILDLRGYTFQWIANGKEDVGLLANEVASIYPSIVKNITLGDGSQIKVVSYVSLVGAVVSALHEIHDKLKDAGEDRLLQQRARIQTLMWRIEALEEGGRWDGRPRTEYDWGDNPGGAACVSLTYNPNISNYQTNQPTTSVQYRCTTNADHPVPAVVECGDGQQIVGTAMNGSPFIGNCMYSTPTMGATAKCYIESHTAPMCQRPVNINWDG